MLGYIWRPTTPFNIPAGARLPMAMGGITQGRNLPTTRHQISNGFMKRLLTRFLAGFWKHISITVLHKCPVCGEEEVLRDHVCGPFRVGDRVELIHFIVKHQIVEITRIQRFGERIYHVYDKYHNGPVTSTLNITLSEWGLKPLKQTVIKRFYEAAQKG